MRFCRRSYQLPNLRTPPVSECNNTRVVVTQPMCSPTLKQIMKLYLLIYTQNHYLWDTKKTNILIINFMKKHSFILFLNSLLWATNIFSANIDTVQTYSSSMNKEIPAIVITPNDYNKEIGRASCRERV